jgi:uridine kinase
VKVIRLSGPTCAGKTTTADKLTAVLEAAGRVVYPISIDDFFYGRDVLEAMAESRPDGKLDYDSVAAIDLPALATCVRDLMETGHARIPVFDFVTGYTTEYRDLTVPDGVEPIFLFEGIQAVYPEVAALFAGIPERSIFINVMKETVLVSPDGTERVFAPDDIRLLRRLVRDEAKRGTSPDFTLTLWHSVRDNEVKSIYPYANTCDYGIDSNMAFDVHMLAPHLRRIFAEQPCDGLEVEWSARILASVEGVEGIDAACLAENSLYHEFILI